MLRRAPALSLHLAPTFFNSVGVTATGATPDLSAQVTVLRAQGAEFGAAHSHPAAGGTASPGWSSSPSPRVGQPLKVEQTPRVGQPPREQPLKVEQPPRVKQTLKMAQTPREGQPLKVEPTPRVEQPQVHQQAARAPLSQGSRTLGKLYSSSRWL